MPNDLEMMHEFMRNNHNKNSRQVDIANKNRELISKRIMNQQTAPTGLYGANNSASKIKKKEYDAISNILNRNQKIQTATKKINSDLRNMSDKQIDNINNKRQ